MHFERFSLEIVWFEHASTVCDLYAFNIVLFICSIQTHLRVPGRYENLAGVGWATVEDCQIVHAIEMQLVAAALKCFGEN